VEVRGDGNEVVGQILVPDFEDATSIQQVVRQVAIMALEKKIDRKTAGLVLYACQIASCNLVRMEDEMPRPVQVVVDPEKVEETPLGMTPWSGDQSGHEIEEPADIAARRAMSNMNRYWIKEYEYRKEWIEERVKMIQEVRGKRPAADREELYSELSFLQTSLESGASGMAEFLKELSH
jgi:hypothetical protein